MTNRKGSSSSTTCKKHPKHQQSPGVCSLCLRARLSKISRASSGVITYTSSSSCSPSSISSISSASSSSNALSKAASPMHGYGKGQLFLLKNKLNRSKSMAFVRERIMEDDAKKKGGFWSKLMHSRAMREMLTTRA